MTEQYIIGDSLYKQSVFSFCMFMLLVIVITVGLIELVCGMVAALVYHYNL